MEDDDDAPAVDMEEFSEKGVIEDEDPVSNFGHMKDGFLVTFSEKSFSECNANVVAWYSAPSHRRSLGTRR